MKKLIFIFMMVMVTIVSNSQTYNVVDTALVMDDKYVVAKNKLKQLQDTYDLIFRDEKVRTDTTMYLDQTKAFMNYLYKGLAQYSKVFNRYDTIKYIRKSIPTYHIATTNQNVNFDYFQYTDFDTLKYGLIREWDSLSVRLNVLKSDTSYQFTDSPEYDKIIDRRKVLRKRFDIIRGN